MPSLENRMTAEETKILGRRLVEALNADNLAFVDEFFATSYVDRNPAPGTTGDRQGLKQGLAEFKTAFPDSRYTIEEEIAEGDTLVHRLSARGTHKGEFQGIPATGKQAVWSAIHIVRLLNGKIVEHWGIEDQLGMLRQLGLAPMTKVPATR